MQLRACLHLDALPSLSRLNKEYRTPACGALTFEVYRRKGKRGSCRSRNRSSPCAPAFLLGLFRLIRLQRLPERAQSDYPKLYSHRRRNGGKGLSELPDAPSHIVSIISSIPASTHARRRLASAAIAVACGLALRRALAWVAIVDRRRRDSAGGASASIARDCISRPPRLLCEPTRRCTACSAWRLGSVPTFTQQQFFGVARAQRSPIPYAAHDVTREDGQPGLRPGEQLQPIGLHT